MTFLRTFAAHMAVSLAIVIAVFAALALFSLEIAKRADALADHQAREVDMQGSREMLTAVHVGLFKTSHLVDNKAPRAVIERRLEGITAELKLLGARLGSRDDLDPEILERFRACCDAVAKTIDVLFDDRFFAVMFMSESDDKFRAAMDAMTAAANERRRTSCEAAAALADVSGARLDRLLVWGGVFVVIWGVLAFSLARGLYRAIAALVRAARSLEVGDEAAADLARVARRRDELCERAGLLQRFVEQSREITAVGARRKRRLDGFDRAFAAFRGHMAEGSRAVDDATLSLATSAERMGSAMADATRSVDGVAAATRAVTDKAQSIGASADRSLGRVQRFFDHVEAANGRFADLSSAIEGVERQAASIASIAAKTRMLSFNATIEAARAGETGRGFAVVAREIRDLADQAAAAAEAVSKDNGALARGSRDFGETVGVTDRLVQEVLQATHAIHDMVRDQKALADRCAEGAAGAAQEIACLERLLSGSGDAGTPADEADAMSVERAIAQVGAQSQENAQRIAAFLARLRELDQAAGAKDEAA